MDDIFARAKTILIIWADGTDPDDLPVFQEKVQTKAKQAQIAFENVRMLIECECDHQRWILNHSSLCSFLSCSTTRDLVVRHHSLWTGE